MPAVAPTLSPENEAEVRTLARLVEFGRPRDTEGGDGDGHRRGSFAFGTALCNSPALRDRVIAAVREREPGIAVFSVPPGTVNLLGAASAAFPEPPAALFVVDLERLLDSDAPVSPVLASLNASRELWPAAFPCPVVFWLPQFAECMLRDRARDLWRWISHYFEFKDEAPDRAGAAPGEGLRAASLGYDDALNLDADRKLARIAELGRRLAEPEPADDPILMGHRAGWLGELGVLHFSLGDFYRAEEKYRKSLAIYKKLGRLEDVAKQYGNLGALFATRGELDKAEDHLRNALVFDEKRGKLRDMASDNGIRGILCKARGELHEAEEHYRKALEINEKLGRFESAASDHDDLGILYSDRGEFDKAELHFCKALAISEKLGRRVGMARQYGNLGDLYRTRGELDKAEEHYRKALVLNEKLGRLEGIASQRANLGFLFRDRGDTKSALENWRVARDLYRKVGVPHKAEEVQGWIDEAEGRAGGTAGPAPGGD